MNEMQKKIQELSNIYADRIIGFRRHIHQNPELSFQEFETSNFIKSVLREYDIEFTDGWVKTGIVAIINGGLGPGKVVAIRADMDALPIQENSEAPYRSKVKGVMHACGHDVHTASVLGTSIILNELRSTFSGTVKIIFQPGEEKLPGGASLMIEEGVLEDPKPNVIFGQHVHPPLDTGSFGICGGEYMASADEIYITVKGKGGHAATPHNNVDPILIAGQIIVALQTMVSRKSDPLVPSVLSIGKINSVGGATNVIPNEVKLEGTFRTFDETWRFNAHDHIVQMCEQIARAQGGECEVNIIRGYPSLRNDVSLTARVQAAMIEYLGKDQCVTLPKRMSAEDFAFYSHHIPGCFYRMGTGNDRKNTRFSVHTDQFDIDEDALKNSAGLMSWLVWKELQHEYLSQH